MRATTRRQLRRVATATLALGALATSVAPGAGAGPKDQADNSKAKKTLPVIEGFDFGYENVPDKVQSGNYDFTFANTSPVEEHEIVFFKLQDDKDTVEDVVAAANAAVSEDDPYFSDFRGVSYTGPDSVQTTQKLEPGFFFGRADLTDKGRYAYLCVIPQVGTGIPHYQLGMVGTLDVK